MKKTIALFTFFLASVAIADVNYEPLLNTVTLQFHAEQWMTTKTALTTVVINAAVTNQGIDQIQADVMQKLNQLAKADWHLIAFDRQQDKSGLESLQITAQGRLQQSDLAHLRDKAKSISKPGVTFNVDNIQFNPSEEEKKIAIAALRNDLYQQAKVEMDNLNKLYPEQKYYVHTINFMQGPPVVAESYMAKMAPQVGMAVQAAPLSVGNKAELWADVVFAAMPDAVVQALEHK